MCKVFAMTNMANVKVNAKFITAVKDQVCKYMDNDGFGYALLGENGTIGGERTMKPKLFRPLQANPNDKMVQSLPIVSRSSDFFGKLDLRNPKAFIAHGRLSTNSVSLRNTHPFTNGELALIHNGVVQDPSKKVKNLVTNCDTEILLRYWEQGGVAPIEENVTGYYAIAVLDKQGLLHIVKDDRANLYISYSATVDSYIIATTADIIEGIARSMKWKIETPEEMLDCKYAVFNGNEIISHTDINPRGTGGRAMTASESAALGYKEFEYGETDVDEDADVNLKGWVKNKDGSWAKIVDETPSAASKSVAPILPSESGFKETEPINEDVPDYRESERERMSRLSYEREMDEDLIRQMASDESPRAFFADKYDELDNEQSFARGPYMKDVVQKINNSLSKYRKA